MLNGVVYHTVREHSYVLLEQYFSTPEKREHFILISFFFCLNFCMQQNKTSD